jgi:hypothetical protein
VKADGSKTKIMEVERVFGIGKGRIVEVEQGSLEWTQNIKCGLFQSWLGKTHLAGPNFWKEHFSLRALLRTLNLRVTIIGLSAHSRYFLQVSSIMNTGFRYKSMVSSEYFTAKPSEAIPHHIPFGRSTSGPGRR